MFGSIEKKLPLQQIIKLRHSFLNGHGRLRTAFLLYSISNMAQRVTFYIDGFNFYYGLRRTKNERRFCDAIMPDVVSDGTKRYEVPEKWRPANIVR